MTRHHEEEKEDYTYLYYLAGLFGGFFIGLILESGFIWIPIMGIVGLLFTTFFRSVFVNGRADR
jgi:hypothetical protein